MIILAEAAFTFPPLAIGVTARIGISGETKGDASVVVLMKARLAFPTAERSGRPRALRHGGLGVGETDKRKKYYGIPFYI